MKLLIVETTRPDVRAEIEGWSEEDTDLFVPGKPIGLTPSPMGRDAYHPKTVFEALAFGYRLFGPPQEEQCERIGFIYHWWLTKE